MPDNPPEADGPIYRAEDIKVLAIPETFFGLLQAVRERPGMYIGRKSLRDFAAWLWGFRFARIQLRADPLPDEAEFEGFDPFVCEKYDWHDVGGWAAKIADYHRDDANAFDEFFRLLDEFRTTAQRPTPRN